MQVERKWVSAKGQQLWTEREREKWREREGWRVISIAFLLHQFRVTRFGDAGSDILIRFYPPQHTHVRAQICLATQFCSLLKFSPC